MKSSGVWSAAAVLACTACAACGASEPEPAVVSTQSMAVAAIQFTSEDRGVAPGFDLDGRTSGEDDRETCGHEDFTDSSGTPGIDNEFASIFGLIDAVAPGAVTSLVQQNIDDGLMLLVAELQTLDNGQKELVLRSTSGEPLLGTDGRLLDRQTFDMGAAKLLGRTRDVRVTPSGDIEAGPFDVHLEITIFARLYKMTLAGGYFRYTLSQGEQMKPGLVGGAVPIEELHAALVEASAAAEADYTSLFSSLIDDTADMNLDQGRCRALSIAFGLELVSAFTASP